MSPCALSQSGGTRVWMGVQLRMSPLQSCRQRCYACVDGGAVAHEPLAPCRNPAGSVRGWGCRCACAPCAVSQSGGSPVWMGVQVGMSPCAVPQYGGTRVWMGVQLRMSPLRCVAVVSLRSGLSHPALRECVAHACLIVRCVGVMVASLPRRTRIPSAYRIRCRRENVPCSHSMAQSGTARWSMRTGCCWARWARSWHARQPPTPPPRLLRTATR
jgi:hypothetical protein